MNAALNAPPRTRLLVVDDEPDLRTLYELTLLREGHHVEVAADLAEARALLAAQTFDVLLTDWRLPDGTGLDLLKELQAAHWPGQAVVITAYGSSDNAVHSLKAGAFEYLTKPVDLAQFRQVMAQAVALAQSKAGHSAPAAAPESGNTPLPTPLDRLIGDTPAMRTLKSQIAKVAVTMAPVLVQGESGTGKELVARALHDCSHRASGPFVAVNCSAIPESLLEAEFFGAKKGAYTGATQDRIGFFKAAEGGTLFLDEIGELPLAMQSKLLRAIQERAVRSLGSNTEERVDVRIVSATHRDLADDVQTGRFRQDLFYRLNVIGVMLPPLRERTGDLPNLATHLLARMAKESGLPPATMDADFVEDLMKRPWPGNVRELENHLHRALAMSDDGVLHADCEATAALAPSVVAAAPEKESTEVSTGSPPSEPAADTETAPPLPTGDYDLQAWLDAQERHALKAALAAHGYHRTATAASLGLNLRQIRYRMTRLGIQAPRGHDGSGDDDDSE